MIDAVVTRFGLARMPFGRDLPPSRLHRHAGCGEAAARITWAVADKTIAMITGEVGTGKTVAFRSAVADLDPPATPSSTSATRRPGSGGYSPTWSRPSEGSPSTAPPPSPSRPGPSWPGKQQSGAGPRS